MVLKGFCKLLVISFWVLQSLLVVFFPLFSRVLSFCSISHRANLGGFQGKWKKGRWFPLTFNDLLVVPCVCVCVSCFPLVLTWLILVVLFLFLGFSYRIPAFGLLWEVILVSASVCIGWGFWDSFFASSCKGSGAIRLEHYRILIFTCASYCRWMDMNLDLWVFQVQDADDSFWKTFGCVSLSTPVDTPAWAWH